MIIAIVLNFNFIIWLIIPQSRCGKINYLINYLIYFFITLDGQSQGQIKILLFG